MPAPEHVAHSPTRDPGHGPKATVGVALRAVAAGQPVMVWGGTSVAPGATLVVAGDAATAEHLVLATRVAGGPVTVAARRDVVDRLGLRPAAVESGRVGATVDLADGTRIGPCIGAQVRAACVRRLAAPDSAPSDFRSPGHLPLVVSSGRSLAGSTGHAEAAIALMEHASRPAVALFANVLDRTGAVADEDVAAAIAHELRLPMIGIEELQRWWRRRYPLVERTAESRMATVVGDFRVLAYRSLDTDVEHLALLLGDPGSAVSPLARIHSECLTGDALGSIQCECGVHLQGALQAIVADGVGVIVYLRRKRGGLAERLTVCVQQDPGLNAVETDLALGHPADPHHYDEAAQILEDLRLGCIRLLTNDPRGVEALVDHDIRVPERVPLVGGPTEDSVDHRAVSGDRVGSLLETMLSEHAADNESVAPIMRR